MHCSVKGEDNHFRWHLQELVCAYGAATMLAKRGLASKQAVSCHEDLQYCRGCSGTATIASRAVAMHQGQVIGRIAASRATPRSTEHRHGKTPCLDISASCEHPFMNARLNVECPVLGFWALHRVRRDAASRKLRERVCFQRFVSKTRKCCANPAQRSALSRLVTPATRGSLLDGSTSSTTPGL